MLVFDHFYTSARRYNLKVLRQENLGWVDWNCANKKYYQKIFCLGSNSKNLKSA